MKTTELGNVHVIFYHRAKYVIICMILFAPLVPCGTGHMKMPSYPYRNSHHKDTTVSWQYDGNPIPENMVFRLKWAPVLLHIYMGINPSTLQWCHNEHDGISNHQPHNCFLKRLFGCRLKKTSKLCVTGLYAWNSPVTQRAQGHKWHKCTKGK